MEKETKVVETKQEELNELLVESVRQMGLELPEDVQAFLEGFEIYMRYLLEYNAHTNLTAITEPKDVYQKHFVDSLTTLKAMEVLETTGGFKKEGKQFIDVGTGAGFPSIPVKIALPAMELTLLDSLQKRTTFLKELVKKLSLEKVKVYHQRAEDGARQKDIRENFDVVLSRAVANLPVLLEYCLPFIKKGGYMICLKGPSVTDEIQKSHRALKLLGGKVIEIMDVTIPFTDLNHKIVIIKKIETTDKRYPRKAGQPSKEPL